MEVSEMDEHIPSSPTEKNHNNNIKKYHKKEVNQQ